jgi:hypothetical protein
MKWFKMPTFENMSLCCSICKQMIDFRKDVYYCDPVYSNDDERHWVGKLWKCDPILEFRVCAECCSSLANDWLDDEIKKYKRRKTFKVIDGTKEV